MRPAWRNLHSLTAQAKPREHDRSDFSSPILRINSDGTTTKFASKLPEFPNEFRMFAHSIDPTGTVYELIKVRGGEAIHSLSGELFQ